MALVLLVSYVCVYVCMYVCIVTVENQSWPWPGLILAPIGNTGWTQLVELEDPRFPKSVAFVAVPTRCGRSFEWNVFVVGRVHERFPFQCPVSNARSNRAYSE